MEFNCIVFKFFIFSDMITICDNYIHLGDLVNVFAQCQPLITSCSLAVLVPLYANSVFHVYIFGSSYKKNHMIFNFCALFISHSIIVSRSTHFLCRTQIYPSVRLTCTPLFIHITLLYSFIFWMAI